MVHSAYNGVDVDEKSIPLGVVQGLFSRNWRLIFIHLAGQRQQRRGRWQILLAESETPSLSPFLSEVKAPYGQSKTQRRICTSLHLNRSIDSCPAAHLHQGAETQGKNFFFQFPFPRRVTKTRDVESAPVAVAKAASTFSVILRNVCWTKGLVISHVMGVVEAMLLGPDVGTSCGQCSQGILAIHCGTHQPTASPKPIKNPPQFCLCACGLLVSMLMTAASVLRMQRARNVCLAAWPSVWP